MSEDNKAHNAKNGNRKSNWVNGKLWAYNAFIIAISPLIALKKLRLYQKKKILHSIDPWRWSGRRPDTPLNEALSIKSGPRVVFAGTGFGELQIMRHLSALLEEARPDCEIVWAMRCRKTGQLIRREHPEKQLATIPFEFLLPLWRWLRVVRPDVYVSVDKLWTPNLVWAVKSWGAKTVAVNSNARSYNFADKRARAWAPLNAWALSGFDIICLQRDRDREQLKEILSPDIDVRITGIMKFESSTQSSPDDEVAVQLHRSLSDWMHETQGVPILIAGSTHEREEEFVIDAFDEVLQKNACSLLIAPRHNERASEVVALLEERGYQVRLRSQFVNDKSEAAHGNNTSNKKIVYVLDTVGELVAAYAHGVAAFVGGTLYMNGHNVAEPVHCGIAASFGQGNTKDTVDKQMRIICCEVGVGCEVSTPHELALHWLQIVSDPEKREQIRIECQRLLAIHQGASQRNLEAILELMPSPDDSQEWGA